MLLDMSAKRRSFFDVGAPVRRILKSLLINTGVLIKKRKEQDCADSEREYQGVFACEFFAKEQHAEREREENYSDVECGEKYGAVEHTRKKRVEEITASKADADTRR